MYLYHNTTTGEFGLPFNAVRSKFPNVSLPKNIEQYGGYIRYLMTPPPATDWNEVAVEIAPVDGEQQWRIDQITPEQAAALVETQQEHIRALRDDKIRETDWMMLPDSPLSEEQTQAVIAYRAALRDVPAQSGFPWVVQWPTLSL